MEWVVSMIELNHLCDCSRPGAGQQSGPSHCVADASKGVTKVRILDGLSLGEAETMSLTMMSTETN